MRKRRRYYAAAALLLSVSLTACAGGRDGGQLRQAEEETTDTILETTAETGAITSEEELPFPVGQKIESDSFTGNVYIETMIANDETYHFPQTNHLTFEPGARSSWHSHGGMVLLITGGIGYYQQEGEPAQILRKGDVVDIEPGVIKNWHIHEGGQILIATDGVGYHQIEGEEVQALYPGDVAFCPPGVPHWHGGSADTSFAHIAVNTNPELTGLEWLGRISEEEYEALPAGEKAAP